MKPSISFLLMFTLIFLLIGLGALVVNTAHAAGPIRVSVHGAPSGNCGNSWENTCGLQYALTSVAVSGDELWVAAGIYTPTATGEVTATFQTRSGIRIYGGFAMTESLSTERNWQTNVTVLSGDIGAAGDSSDNVYHVVTGTGTNSTAILDGFIIRDGNASGPYPDDHGGGMLIDSGNPTLANLRFISNSANYGGGIYNSNSYPTLTNVTFISNSAAYGGGMAIPSGYPSLMDVTFVNNSADVGGGLDFWGGGSLTLTNVTFISNTASGLGGGMDIDGGYPTLTNVTFIGNSSNYSGGGISILAGSPTLKNTTFTGNSATTAGGGVSVNGGSPLFRNSIFWGNTAPAAPQINKAGGVLSISDSVIADGCPPGSTCSNITTADPLLGPLGSYGGNTQTIPLLPGSSAIDAGNDTTCAPQDQRGITRAGQGAHCDIGAFESRGFALTRTTGDDQSATITTAFPTALGATIASPFAEPIEGGKVRFTGPASGASTNPTVNDGSISGGTVSKVITANGIGGSYSVVAGGPGFANSVAYDLTNLKADTTATIMSDTPDPSVVGQPVLVTYSVAPLPPAVGTPSGNVTVSDGTLSCTGTVAAGQCSIPFTSSGSKTLVATYAGDSNFNSSTSASQSHFVKFATTTTIASDLPDPSFVGQPVPVHYNVTPTAGGGTPTGDVTVGDGVVSCTGTVAAGQCAITLTSAGVKSLTASYAGDDNFDGSVSSPETHQVNKADMTITITADNPDPSGVGQSVTVSYTLTPVAPGAGTPTGDVTVGDGTTSCIGTAAAGTCSLTFTTQGSKTLTATYAGDDNFSGSSSPSESHTVYQFAVTVALVSSANPSVVGQTVTYTATVSGETAPTPTGSATFKEGTTVLCAVVPLAGGKAACTHSYVTPGAHTITAEYSGDSTYSLSTGTLAGGQTVNKANTTTSLGTHTPHPSKAGEAVTVHYSVAVSTPGSGTPSGSVTVSDGVDACTGAVAAGSCIMTLRTVGTRTLTATYVGDTNLNGSASTGVSHTVNPFRSYLPLVTR